MSNYENFLRREAIKQRVADGATRVSVGREFGITGERVGQIAGRKGTQFFWDVESISYARARWDTGLPAAEIAREMGISKNCIIGLAHRNDFTGRPSPIRRKVA